MVLAEPQVRTPPAASLRQGGAAGLVPGVRTWLRLALFGLAMLLAFAGLRVAIQDVLWWLAAAALVVLPLVAIGIASRLGRRPGYLPT